MPKPCRGMATFINLGYFWQLGFWTPIVILLPGSYKKEIVGTFYLSRNLATLAIFIFLNLSRLLRKIVRKSLGN